MSLFADAQMIGRRGHAKRRGSPSSPAAGAAAALAISYRAIDELKPYVNNARTHSAKQIAKIEASLSRFGWTTPLGVAGDDLLYGHARLAAAQNMRREARPIARDLDANRVPTVDLSPLSAAERRAYIIADNKLASDAGWDNNLLRIDMNSLRLDGFELTLTGFNTLELNTLLGVAGAPERPRITDGMSYQIVIECNDEHHQGAILARLQGEGLKARPLIL